MSWDADLLTIDLDGHPRQVGEWNYTHNTNRMIERVLETVGVETDKSWLVGCCWWQHLDGASAKESLKFFDLVIGALAEAPSLFREMNPENGWGNYDDLLDVLCSMRDAAAEHPSASWSTSG